MAATTYSLKQSLPVVTTETAVHIGLAPPNAIEIEDAPPGLAELLGFASHPRTLDDLGAKAQDLLGGDSGQIVEELIEADILVPYRFDLTGRYSRHDLYFELAHGTGPGASDLLRSRKVALIGVGGIGTNVAMQLATAGVGVIMLVDGDTVEESNLTRQYLFTAQDVGASKIEAAARNLQLRAPATNTVEVAAMISGVEDLLPIFQDADFVVVSADTPQEVLEWSNEASIATGTPFTCAGYQDTRGVVGPVVRPGTTPCLQCAATDNDVRTNSRASLTTANLNTAYQAPSFGPLNAIVASIAAMEVFRYLLTGSTNLDGRRLVFDSLELSSEFEDFARNKRCAACS
ncbi:TOMM precursor leader peptide-binding protein [Arthrobacter sp. AK01]|uniref:TOMM precursor leader peptide-binding protein n=1 Tax=Micrococcaceae TaxID=1268 RepID=UPI001E47AE91|nr:MULTISPECIES: TOMM precursor leader peptide-binding protein [Micrococcaceae]MCD4853031.1 TOMM precursor leader peptide-binding protein [Arthrobacter sp. AK01]MCP1411489.1 molybdopterin/thiamine biosynthesis adenylyltransferase [Paenarthrobacter sp. A20]